MDFSKLQLSLPWTRIWAESYLSDSRPYAGLQHCLTNVAAKLGAIFQRIEMSDHYGMDYELGLNREKDGVALAFIVMSAMKAANCYPGGPIELWPIIESDLKRRAK